MSDLFSAAAKPLLFAENECIEARSLRKRQPARQSTHFLTVEDAGACSSDEAKSLCTTSDEESSGRNKHRAQEQQEKPFQPRLRRNSLGKPSLVTATRFLPSSTPKSSVTTDEVIRRVVEWAIDNASTDVDLAHQNIKQLPECISDLRLCTLLAPHPPRTSSSRKGFRKSHSDSTMGIQNSSSSPPLNLQLPGNLLTTASIPESFWTITNLTVLSLRNNQLEVLPDQIGQLTQLKALNISANKLSHLPSSILRLERLEHFLCCPNQFIPRPDDAALHQVSKRTLSKPTVHRRIPSLVESCQRLLLSLQHHHSSVRTDAIKHLSNHPHLLKPHLPVHYTSKHRCSNPDHASLDSRAFIEPCIERMEWRSEIAGCPVSPPVPVLHRGCQIHCLDHLEHAPPPASPSADDDWTF